MKIAIIFNLILMRIQDLHWKKMDPDPDPGYLLKFTEFF